MGLLVLLGYLILLRAQRLSAEEWLENNSHILFTHAKKIKADEDILEQLVDAAEKNDYRVRSRAYQNAQNSVDRDGSKRVGLLTDSGNSPQKQRTTSHGNKKPAVSKGFESDADKDYQEK